jgi:hypothetical protein
VNASIGNREPFDAHPEGEASPRPGVAHDGLSRYAGRAWNHPPRGADPAVPWRQGDECRESTRNGEPATGRVKASFRPGNAVSKSGKLLPPRKSRTKGDLT